MAPAKQPAAAPADAANEDAADEERVIQHPFDPETTEAVLDVRALCQLPVDPDEDGVHSFRALLLAKGKTVHVPDEPGCYAMSAPWRIHTCLGLVHFHASTKREDELLLSFVDYGMVSSSMTGIYVETLQLPLQKQRNIYEETARFTSIKDVIGFSNINPRAQPWCALLKPALERQPKCDDLDVYSSLDVITMLKTALATRLKKLKKIDV